MLFFHAAAMVLLGGLSLLALILDQSLSESCCCSRACSHHCLGLFLLDLACFCLSDHAGCVCRIALCICNHLVFQLLSSWRYRLGEMGLKGHLMWSIPSHLSPYLCVLLCCGIFLICYKMGFGILESCCGVGLLPVLACLVEKSRSFRGEDLGGLHELNCNTLPCK